MKERANVVIFSQGRGHMPWTFSGPNPRVIIDDQYAICGMLDIADLTDRAIDCVNGDLATPFPREGKGVLPWRVGTSVGRTLYDGAGTLIGVMDTPALAAQVVAAVNERGTTR